MKSIIIANWKMNPVTMREAKKLFESSRKAAEAAKNVSLIVAPPALFLRELSGSYKGKRVAFAVQNAHFESSGSFTGETSMTAARDAKASYVLIGHAERRAMGETNENVAKKVAAALAEKLTPVLCVGESARDAGGSHFNIVREQLRAALKSVPPARIGKLLIAYEPVWAIGAKKPMGADDMHEMAIFIRKMVVEQIGQQGMAVKILYGGSIDETNAADMLQKGDVVGLLVGRASTDARKLSALIESLGA